MVHLQFAVLNPAVSLPIACAYVSRPMTAASTKCPTEIGNQGSGRRSWQRTASCRCHRKNTDLAAFIGAQSMNKPAEYYDPDATANANLAARLPYIFRVLPFAHHLGHRSRPIGSFQERWDMERWLNDWIQLRRWQPGIFQSGNQARCPLAAAEVVEG